MKTKLKFLFLLLLLAGSGFAQQNQLIAQRNEVVSDLKAFKVIIENKKEKLVPAESVLPGDIIEYQLTYSNQTNGAISNLRPILPIPEGMVFIDQSAKPSMHAVSITDDQVFQVPPIVREITLPNGSKGKIKVDAKEYRFIQWLQESMAKGDTKVFKARMRIIAPKL